MCDDKIVNMHIDSDLISLSQRKTHIFHPKTVFSLPANKYQARPRSTSELERKELYCAEIKKIRFLVNLARKIKLFLIEFSNFCLKDLYAEVSDLEDYNHIHKYNGKRFNRIFAKNIFRMLSQGHNIFKYEDLIKMTKSDLINSYDIEWIERKLNQKLETNLNSTIYNQSIINVSIIKPHPLRVIKRFINNRKSNKGFYYFVEWKDHLKITQKQYLRLQSRYNSIWSLFNEYVFLLLLRYSSLGSNNFHCSVPPEVIKKYNLGEFFGSPFNTISDIYYSPFDDIEYLFGSQGNFFTSEIRPGNYICNPPFDPIIIKRTFVRIMKILKEVSNICILVNIPEYYYTEVESLDQYKDDIENYKTSKYALDNTKLEKDEFKHYNYYSDSYIAVSDSELILFSNYDNNFSLNDIVTAWKKSIESS